MQLLSRLRRGDKGNMRRVMGPWCLMLVCCFWSHSSLADHGGAFPPAAPAVLVDGPVNLTWAANHDTYWQERGIDGFILYGLEGLFTEPEDGADDNESPLLREIRVAQQRLRVAGLGRNFFHWDIQDGWQKPGSPREALRIQARKAATFARAAHLQGIAIRLPRDSTALQPDAAPATHTPAAIQERTQALHETGLRIIREILGAHPHGEILLLVEEPFSAGRDWWALVEGMLAGPDAAPIPLHFVDLSSRTIKRALDFQARRESLQRHAGLALSPAGFALWQRHAAPAFCVSLFDQQDQGVAASHSLESSRLLSLAAATYSDYYSLVQSVPGGLWEVTDERAATYSKLQQQVAVEATSPLLPQAHQLNLSTPLARLRRIGPFHDEDGAPVFVLHGPEGASVLFWGGLAAPTKLPSRAAMVELWSPLHHRTRSLVPEDGFIVIPPEKDPILVRGLPVDNWSLPAALALHAKEPFREGNPINTLSIRIANPATVPLEASLSLWAPEGIGAGRQTITVNLAPGAFHGVEREIRGQWSAGDHLDFQLVLTRPGNGILTRSFGMPVAPSLAWQQHLPAPVSASPVMLQAENKEPLVAVTSGKRYVSAFDTSGTLAWEYDHGAAASLEPLPIIGAVYTHLPLLSENDGVLMVDAQGKATTFSMPDDQETDQAIALWHYNPSAAPHLLTLQDENTLTAWDTGGTRAWERRWEERPALLPPQYPLVENDLPPPPLILLFADAQPPALEAIAPSGATLWTGQAPQASDGDALLFHGTEGWQIALWDRISKLWILDAATGRQAERRISTDQAVQNSFEMRPIPAERQVRLMFHGRASGDVLEFDQGLRSATMHDFLPVDHLRGFQQQSKTAYWGVKGRRVVGLAPRWDEPPLNAAPSGLMLRKSPDSTTALRLHVLGGTEIRVLQR